MKETLLQDYQQLLYPIALNLLGNPDDAEDLVQETMLKWLSMEKRNIENIRAYLVKTLVNKGLNFLRDRKRARSHEEKLIPMGRLVADRIPFRTEQAPTLSLSLLAMMEKLSPLERAVVMLKEIFGYSHREIAELLEISEANCRQILRRAKGHLRENRVRFQVVPDQHQQLYETFMEVCEGEDLGQLLEILKDDIKVDLSRPAAVAGKLATAEYVLGWYRQGVKLQLRPYSGHWGLAAYVQDELR
ncbi:MAG: sigma-70 family RNA polymerase sigma factor, partial [Bacteroidota bacterium]